MHLVVRTAMEETFKFCHKCGHKCSIESMFCSRCGTRLEEFKTQDTRDNQDSQTQNNASIQEETIEKPMQQENTDEKQEAANNTKQCPYCGKTIKFEAKKCRYCGKWLNRINFDNLVQKFKDNLKKSSIDNKLIILCTIVVVLLIFFLNQPISLIRRAPNCESIETKKQLIQIFKQNSHIYENIYEKSIQKIEVDMPVILSYDKGIDKYHCEAKIKMYSTSGGFGFKKGYYSYSHKYTEYDSGWVEYTTQISEGKPLVLSSTEYNDYYWGLKK